MFLCENRRYHGDETIMHKSELYMIIKSEDALTYCTKQSMLEQMVGNEKWLHYYYAGIALGKQIPQKPDHIYERYPKHDWYRDDNGEIDMWFMDVGFHNGPGCKRCHATFCEHCDPDWDEEECTVDEMRCPTCGEKIDWPYEKNKYCRNCGQALDWCE